MVCSITLQAMGLFNITLGVPDDIASWVSYVASPQSQFMTGRHLSKPYSQSLYLSIGALFVLLGQSTIIDGGVHFD